MLYERVNMARIAFVNGRYAPLSESMVNIEDRGYQFSDGIYEVIALVDGCLVDETPHLDRLWRSLSELKISEPLSRPALKLIIREVLRRNYIYDGIVYIQVTRGVAPRDHAFPQEAKPSVVIYAKRKPLKKLLQKAKTGVHVITVPDQRWQRCDIKTISLLPNCLGKQQAVEQGAYEAWQIDQQGYVTEGTSSNAWIVTAQGVLVTCPASQNILRGITRDRILALAQSCGLGYEERLFTLEEAYQAREAMVSSATSLAMPVIKIDDHMVGNGHPGDFASVLLEAYCLYMKEKSVPVPGLRRS